MILSISYKLFTGIRKIIIIAILISIEFISNLFASCYGDSYATLCYILLQMGSYVSGSTHLSFQILSADLAAETRE